MGSDLPRRPTPSQRRGLGATQRLEVEDGASVKDLRAGGAPGPPCGTGMDGGAPGLGGSGGGGGGAGDGKRASTRVKKLSERFRHVDDHTRAEAASRRLAALEADNADAGPAGGGDDSDEEYDAEEEAAPGRPRKAAGAKRKTRAALAERKTGVVVKTFALLLEESGIETLPAGTPTYLTAAVGPPRVAARRFFCSVCGFTAPYTCPRCGSRFCCRRCQETHSETRCLKFMV